MSVPQNRDDEKEKDDLSRQSLPTPVHTTGSPRSSQPESVEQLRAEIAALRLEIVGYRRALEMDCICDGGGQGEGCVSLPHEPHCPLFAAINKAEGRS